MTKSEIAASLQAYVDAYNRTLEPDVSVAETACAGLTLLRETARLVVVAGANSRQRAYAESILVAIDGDAV